MIGSDGHGFVFGRDDDGPPGQVVRLSEEPPGALVDSGYRRFIEDVVRCPADVEVMPQVFVHLTARDPFQVTSRYNPGGKRHRRTIHQAVDQVGLSGKDDGKLRFGVLFELGQRVKLGKDFQSQQRRFVDYQHGL